MAGRITPGPNVSGLGDNFAASFVTASDGKPALAVTNTDGTSISSGGGGGGAATIADGADVTQGAIADASVTAGATGTVSAKLRRISADIGSILTNTPAAGQAAMAASSPVVIASNQSAVPVTLTSTTITGTVAATQSGTWTAGSNSATGSAVPANAFYVAATNSSGNLTGAKDNSMNDGQASGVLSSQSVVYNGTTSDKSRSATSASGTTGTGVPAAGSMGFDGTNYQRIKTDTSGNVSVNPSSATGSTVPANAFYIGGMTSTGNLNAVNMMNQTANVTGNGVIQSGQMGQFDDVSPTAVTENQFGNLRMSANRNAYTTIRDAAGNERGVNVTAGNAMTVDGSASTQPVSQATGTNLHTVVDSGTITSIGTSIVPGTAATNLGKAEDAVHTSGDTGVMMLGVRNDTAATRTSTDGDYGAPSLDLTGAMLTREQYAPGAEDNTNNVIAVVRKAVVASTYSPTATTSFGTATKANPKAAAGVFTSLSCTNENAAVRYLQIHNKASAPAGTDVPIFSVPIPAGSTNAPGAVILDREFLNDYYLGTGVSWAISTTKATFTDSATAGDHTLNGTYV
jgi:hypothetical protein